MADLVPHSLLTTDTVEVRDVACNGAQVHTRVEEVAGATYLVFPYRGVFVRQVGTDYAVADANQVLFFNRDDGYSISHPVPGGDACLSLRISEPLLIELAPAELRRSGSRLAFRRQRLRIDARAQALVAMLRHSLREGTAEPLEAETLALTLTRRAFGLSTSHPLGASVSLQRLADRVKLLLASDPTRRWTLAEIAGATGHSAVYLTQVFQQVEGMPLYRYHLRQRLARALELLPHADDLTSLSLDLGFSSHSHFSTAFAKTYGCSPSQFKHRSSNR